MPGSDWGYFISRKFLVVLSNQTTFSKLNISVLGFYPNNNEIFWWLDTIWEALFVLVYNKNHLSTKSIVITSSNQSVSDVGFIMRFQWFLNLNRHRVTSHVMLFLLFVLTVARNYNASKNNL